MANSSTVSSGDLATATQYNNLRSDVLDTSTGHVHDGTNGRGDAQTILQVSGTPLVVENSTDATSNQVLLLRGDNSTRADGDEVYVSFYLNDSGGNSTEFARITAEAVDVTDGQEDGQLRFGVAKTNGTITDVFTINSSTGGETSMTLDVSGDLTLDADGGDIFFKDGGTTFGSATNNSGNLIIKSGTTTALNFSGADVTVAGDLTITGDDLKMTTNTDTYILVADGTSYNPVAVSGDVTIANNGAVTIANDAVESGMLNDNVISGQTELASGGIAAADELPISDGGTLKKIGVDNFIIDAPALLAEAAIANGDYVVFLDGGATGSAKKEALADVATLFAGTGISASSSVLSIDAAQTGITSLLATDIKIGEDDQTKIDFEDANTINFYANNAKEVVLAENSLSPGTSDGTALGTTSLMWSDLFVASGGVINFNNGDMTLTHSSNTLTAAGGTVATAALTTSTIVASGIVKTDDTTNATSTTDGSLQTDGGLSVVLDAVFGDDVSLLTDSAVLGFGADKDTTLTHTDGTGLTLNSTNKLTFGDAASFIQQSADGTLRIDGEAIIDLNASTRVDVSGDLKVGGEVQTASIGYTDGDNAITIADGGGATFPQKAVFSGEVEVDGALNIDGSVDADVTDVQVDSSGDIDLVSTNNAASAIYLHANGGTSETITLHSDQGTSKTEGAASIELLSDVGGIELKSGLNASQAIHLIADGGTSETILIRADQGTSANAIYLQADAGGMKFEAASDIILGTDAKLYLNETADGDITTGISINQGAADDDVMSLKSSDVDHPMTGVAETDTYGQFAKVIGASGGLKISGYSDLGYFATSIRAYAGAAPNEVHTASGLGIINLDTFMTDGSTGTTAPSGNDNILAVTTTGASAKFIIDADGDIFYDGSAAAYDGEDDISLLRAVQKAVAPDKVVSQEFDKFLTANEDDLVALGILGGKRQGVPDEDRGLVCLTKLTQLLTGAAVQLYGQLTEKEERIQALETKMLAIGG